MNDQRDTAAGQAKPRNCGSIPHVSREILHAAAPLGIDPTFATWPTADENKPRRHEPNEMPYDERRDAACPASHQDDIVGPKQRRKCG